MFRGVVYGGILFCGELTNINKMGASDVGDNINSRGTTRTVRDHYTSTEKIFGSFL